MALVQTEQARLDNFKRFRDLGARVFLLRPVMERAFYMMNRVCHPFRAFFREFLKNQTPTQSKASTVTISGQ